MHAATKAAVGTAALGATALAWSTGVEVRWFRLRRVTVPLLPVGQPALRVLHLSDLHLTPGQLRKQRWVRALDRLDPDLVVVTGDFMAHREAVPFVLDALDPLLERPGVFVFGSNDYYAPRLKNPLKYLLPDDGRRVLGQYLPWEDLRDGLTAAGWTDLTNARALLEVDGRYLDLRGVDDPHIKADRYPRVAGPFDADADVAVGVTHAPYKRVVDPMTLDGAGIVFAGHTHGGQVAVPFYGALVTNCDIERERAKGLHRYATPFEPGVPGRDRPGLGGADGRGAWLHVSAGLGTSPYAPIRFACPPEATLVTLTAMEA